MAENISHWPSLQLTPLYGPETYMTSVAINVIVLDISSSKSAGLAKPFFWSVPRQTYTERTQEISILSLLSNKFRSSLQSIQFYIIGTGRQ